MGGVEDCVRLPDALCLPPEARTLESLVGSIFGEGRWDDTEWMTGRAVLAARNDEVDHVNDVVSQLFSRRFPANEPAEELLSSDNVDAEEEQGGAYPVEYLKSLNPSGLPPHKLCLRKGMPVILLRNLNGARGLANGIRLIVRGVSRHVLMHR